MSTLKQWREALENQLPDTKYYHAEMMDLLEAGERETNSLQGHLRRVELTNSKMGVKDHETELARQQKISGG